MNLRDFLVRGQREILHTATSQRRRAHSQHLCLKTTQEVQCEDNALGGPLQCIEEELAAETLALALALALEGYRQFAGIPTNVSERVYALAREARRVGPGVRRPPPDCLSLVS